MGLPSYPVKTILLKSQSVFFNNRILIQNFEGAKKIYLTITGRWFKAEPHINKHVARVNISFLLIFQISRSR